MVRADVVAAKLAELARRVERVRAHCPSSAAALRSDEDALDLVAFNLMLAVQCSVDVASHIIADEGWAPALTLGESFDRLAQHGVLRTESAAPLKAAAGLRNVVAHGYAAVDAALVFAAATKGTDDLTRFASEVAAWVVARGRASGT